MKKTYITPEALTISLAMTLPLAMSTHDEIGDGQLVKGFVDDFDNLVDDNSNTSSITSIWDEEW